MMRLTENMVASIAQDVMANKNQVIVGEPFAMIDLTPPGSV